VSFSLPDINDAELYTVDWDPSKSKEERTRYIRLVEIEEDWDCVRIKRGFWPWKKDMVKLQFRERIYG
jgi:hypothetical protein